MKVLKKEDIFKISSKKQGPKICILGGVHGDEICGVEAIQSILNNSSFKLKKGEITLIYANRKAINSNVRFVEENLNRCFLENKPKTNSYEENLANDLKEILNECDICLDIHASFSKESQPFIICEKNAFEYIKYFPITKVCSGFDKYESGGTDYYMNLIKKIGICIECGYLADKNSKKIAINSIFSLLKTLDMIENFELIETKKEYLKLNDLYYAKSKFSLVKEFKDFEKLKKGELIGIDGNSQIKAKNDGFIIFARNRKLEDKDKEAFLYGKTIKNKND